MSNYTKTTNFGAKDTLPSGDSQKIIRGSEFDTEFNAISTAIATKVDTGSYSTYYPKVSSETSGSVTVTNYEFAPWDGRRYGSAQNPPGSNLGPNLVSGHPYNAVATDLSVCIVSGGSTSNPQLIGYQEFRDRFSGDGATNAWTTTFVATTSTVRVRLIRADKVRVTITSDCTITQSGSYVSVTYPKAGNFVNDGPGGSQGTNAYVLSTQSIEIIGVNFSQNLGSGSNFSGIYGGYDNIIQSGVANHIIGAHHRITENLNGHNTILGGSYGRIDAGGYSVVLGGTANEITATGTGSLILGGNGNVTSGSGPSYIIGGSANALSGVQAAIVGGSNNVVSGNGALVGGRENSVTGRDALVAGFDNTASNVYTFAAGLFNVASGAYSAVFGRENIASAENSFARGRDASATLLGADTIGGGKFLSSGDCQSSVVVIRQQTTNNIASTLLSQSSALTVPTNTVWAFRCLVSARRVDGGGSEAAAYSVTGAIRNDAGTTALLGTPTITVLGEDVAAWDVSVAANNTTDTLEIRVTGETSKTINWVGRLEISEVSG